MKRAKVSAVYEGKRKRYREEEKEEEGNSSRKARQRAKARKYGSRANARTRCGTRRTIMTRSKVTLSNLAVEKGNQEMEKVVVVEEEKRCEINVFEAEPVGGVAEMLEEGLKGLDWPPPVLTYEEEHWFGVGIKWDPYWDVMTGDVWLGGEGIEENDWVVNIWDF